MKNVSSARIEPIKSLKIGDCFVRATLDPRNPSRTGKRYVVLIYYIRGSGRLYQQLPYSLNPSEYTEVQHSTGRGRRPNDQDKQDLPYNKKLRIIEDFDSAVKRLQMLAGRNPITFQMLKAFLSSKGSETFTDLWLAFNAKKSLGTRNAYNAARASFIKYVGNVQRTYITADDIELWERGMSKDGISLTTIGMHERACRAAWNAAVKKGLASKDDHPFGRIPQGSDRKKEWLDVDRMSELFLIFENKNYPAEWNEVKRSNVHQALGLFLFQYLANGCNLADVANLRYDNDYSRSNGTIFSFIRQKTSKTSSVEVIVPITDDLRVILRDIAENPEDGELVFPQIYKGAMFEEARRKRVAQVNKEVREFLRELTDSLGWKVKPSGTWTRHSFATNLSNAGVPERYISEAMGHTVSGVTTLRYIDRYPLDRQIAYNSKLLNCHNQDNLQAETVTLTKEEYERLLKLAGKSGM